MARINVEPPSTNQRVTLKHSNSFTLEPSKTYIKHQTNKNNNLRNWPKSKGSTPSPTSIPQTINKNTTQSKKKTTPNKNTKQKTKHTTPNTSPCTALPRPPDLGRWLGDVPGIREVLCLDAPVASFVGEAWFGGRWGVCFFETNGKQTHLKLWCKKVSICFFVLFFLSVNRQCNVIPAFSRF